MTITLKAYTTTIIHSAGIKGCLFSWLSDYLASRTQRVLVKGCTSKPLPVTSGVPQGSILVSLLFIWYINDLPDAVSNDTLVYQFSVDRKLARIINSPSDVREIQDDITKVSSWTHHWSLKFNFEKCESLSVTRKRQPISKTISQKDLGVLTTPTLKWDLHTLHICSKVQKMLGFQHITSYPRFSVEAKRSLYLSLVRSNLGYASEVWSALPGNNLRMVEGIQDAQQNLFSDNTTLINLTKTDY